MQHFKYPAIFTPLNDESGFVITFRDLPEAITQAESIEEGQAEAADCLDEAISGRIDDGLAIPVPSRPRKKEHIIPVPSQTAFKAALYVAMNESNINKSELARILQLDVREVRRLLNPHHGSKLPVMEKALLALGKEVDLRIN